MTSEVAILNKKGLVLAADSAVTTGMSNGNHPRYSKAANKIFDVSVHGNIAVTIFGAGEIDRVPWELALKMFRATQVGGAMLLKTTDYVSALVDFLRSDTSLFPPGVMNTLKTERLREAMLYILKEANHVAPGVLEEAKTEAERINLWQQAHTNLVHKMANKRVHTSLSDAAYNEAMNNSAAFTADVATELGNSPLGAVITSPKELAELAISALYKEPELFLSFTGLVTAGYGADEVFPQYKCIHVHGHVGNELLIDSAAYMGPSYGQFQISHEAGSWIQAFAQSSMIDVFTDGFGYSLRNIILKQSQIKFTALVDELRSKGVLVPAAISDPIVESVQKSFMSEWTKENYQVNFAPLRAVLSGLSIQEMAHLGENLLTLESLKERVTSPSESVGGPIDIAAITKSEGLVWIKRKHFFDADLNLRYISRTQDHS